MEQQTPGGYVKVAFINTNAVKATSVTFAVTDGGRSQDIVDRGTFAQGTTIEHSFREYDTSAGHNAKCTVSKVDFADGSSWR